MSTPRSTPVENFDQIIRIITISVGIDRLSERTTRTTTKADTKTTITTTQDHHTSQTKRNPEIGEVKKTIRHRLQRHDKIHPSQISADNLDQIHLTLQYLTGLEIETRATIYLTTRNSQLLTTVTSQTWFDSLQETMKLLNYRACALQTTKVSEFNF